MITNRREFLRTILSGAAILPLAGKSLTSDVFTPRSPAAAGDVALLDDLERASFDFFWNESHPDTGLVRDRARFEGSEDRIKASIAATGFGLTALCIGHHRGYRPPPEITARVRKTLRFLAHEAPSVHGYLYHFVDMRNGNRYGISEISPIDMAILLCGVLTCHEYFEDDDIRTHARILYHRVEWPWALNDGDLFPLEWTPEAGFSTLRWDSYCESMMLYLLAIGSPTAPIPAESWRSIKRPWVQYDRFRYISAPAPLFIHQFSHAWFDFRGKRDDYANYFDNSVAACEAHRKFCEELSDKFPCYSAQVWGITASDSSRGYVAWGGPPLQGPIDGTIVPSAAAGSLPFMYRDSLSVLQNLRGYYGNKIWTRYGFVDAFNPLTGWAGPDILGIDAGISMLMAENARSQFVWDTFMRNRDMNIAMRKAGFRASSIANNVAERLKGKPGSMQPS